MARRWLRHRLLGRWWPREGLTRQWWLRLVRRVVLYALALLVLALGCIWLAVRVTPMQTVSAAGQTVSVGAASVTPKFSGPGELELFGQVIPTRLQFDGPIRPRLQLTHITVDAQVSQLVQSGNTGQLELELRQQLVSGWERYLLWETLIAIGFAALIAVAVAGILRLSLKGMIKALVLAVVTVTALNSVAVFLMASSTPRALRQVSTLSDLVGRTPTQPPPAAKGSALTGVQAVVLGDSTAAGLGNALVDNADALDTACGRSKDAYAQYLAAVNNWNVMNLACSGGTVRSGILGPQILGSQIAPPQLSVAQRATEASTVIVSVGANDVHWADQTRVCIAASACDDAATTAYFQQQLTGFSQDYYDLLRALAALPQHPTILINLYYNPFGQDISCLAPEGLTTVKANVLRARVNSLNTVLTQGAQAFGFHSVPQHYEGHQLCSADPFVQGASDQAPLHPTVPGQLAIALADQQALAVLPKPSASPTPTPTSTPPFPPSGVPSGTPAASPSVGASASP